MKKTQIKDAVRNIKKQIVSYLSIIFISMLAVLTYLGINYAAAAIKMNSSEYFENRNFRDVEIFSTYLLTEDDLDAIRAVEGVSDVEGMYRVNCKIYSSKIVTGVTAISLTERINTPVIVKGRMPETVGECVVEDYVLEDTGLEIGDTLTLLSSQHTRPDHLQRCDYVITGVVTHPDHSCARGMTPGPRYVILLPEAFRTGAFDNCYMSALVTIDGADQYSVMSDEYLEYVSGTLERLNNLADERTYIRYNEVRTKMESGIEEGQSGLNELGEGISDARAELDTRWQEYYDGVAQLNDAEQQLNDAYMQLNDARTELDEGATELENVRSQLADARAQLDAARAQLESGWAQIEAGRIQLEEYAVQIERGQQLLAEVQVQIEAGQAMLDHAWAQLQSGRTQLIDGYNEIEDAKTVVRDTLHSAIAAVLGADIANRIDWTPGAYGIDPDDPNVTATELHITASGVTVYLDRSLGDNVFAIISSLGIPEDELRAAYESVTGMIIDITADHPVIQFIVDAIVDAYGAVDSRYNEYAGIAQTWNSYHSEYIRGLNLYNENLASFNAALARYNDSREALDNGIAEYNLGIIQYNDGLAQYNESLARYQEGEAQYAAGLEEYNARLAEYEQYESQYQAGVASYESGLAEYQEGQAQLEEGLSQLEEGEVRYDESIVTYDRGQTRLQTAIDNMESMSMCHWSVMSVEGNSGYLQLRTDIRNVSDMGGTFALVFVLVGALVIYATVGRIIDEQRRLVGATKALGLYNREIFMKYLAFGVTSAFIGEIIGILLGYFVIQRIYLFLYGRNYMFGSGHLTFIVWLTVVIAAAGLAIAGLTVWFACSHLMKSSAVVLMQDSVPVINKKYKKSGSGRSRRSLYSSMIFLNMLSDKKRVLVTIASIAGSCTLLVTGIALNFSINGAIDRQFKQVEIYDLRISYDTGMSESADNRIAAVLDEFQAPYMPVMTDICTYDSNGKLSAFELMVADLGQLGDYYVRIDTNTGLPAAGGNDGIWIFQRLAETLLIGPGDTLTLYDASMDPHIVRIAGVFTVYVGQTVIMSPEAYQETFGTEAVCNSFLVNAPDQDVLEIMDRVSGIKGYTGAFDSASRYDHVKELASALDYISIMFIAGAGLMAYFILLNLVNMYVHQKKTEITIMRINGFYVREVIHYVSMELIVSTVLGILSGLVLGSLLTYRVITLLESIALHFIRDISISSCIIATLFTILFTFLVSAVALRNVKNLRLSDINS